jgi:hypothetical protein
MRYALAVLILLTCADDVLAVDGVRRVKNYWGYYTQNGTSTICDVLLGPPLPPDLIGQEIRECDGTAWSWGNTSCTTYPPTVEYTACDEGFAAAASDSATKPTTLYCDTRHKLSSGVHAAADLVTTRVSDTETQ